MLPGEESEAVGQPKRVATAALRGSWIVKSSCGVDQKVEWKERTPPGFGLHNASTDN